MAKRKVVWTTEAKLSFKEILDYYIERNGNKKYSSSISRRIRKLISYISSYNLIGKSTDEPGIRVIIYNNYEIFYQLSEDEIEVLLIWDSRRNPKDLKLK